MAVRPVAVLSILVTASTSEASAKLLAMDKTMLGVGRSSRSLEKTMTKTGSALTRSVTVPILAVGAASVGMALKFERSMSLIATQAGGTHKEVSKLSKAVLELSKHSEFSPDELSKGLYYIESAGKRGAEAMRTLNIAQKLAAVGNSDVEKTTFALIGAQNALGKEGKNAVKVAAEMNAIVGHGHMRMEDFAESLGSATIGVAQSFGVTFKSLGATVDFFTKRGETADTAMTRLKMTLTHLATNTTTKGADALKEIGVSTEKMAEGMQRGRIGPVVKELAEHLKTVSKIKANQILAEAFGGGRYGAQTRMLVQNVGDLLNLEREVGKAGGVKALNKDFKETSEQGLYKLKVTWSSIQAGMIEVGKELLPTVVSMLQRLGGLAITVGKGFAGLPTSVKEFVIGLGPALLIGGKILGTYKSLKTTIEAITASNVVAGLAGGLGDLGAAFSLGLPGLRMLGADWGGALIGGLTKALPPLAAAAGIGNIIYAATQGNWQKAGFEAAGSLVGGIAGGLVGGPAGAMIGVGIGSLLGGVVSDLEGKISPDFGIAHSLSEMTAASHSAQRASTQLKSAREREKDATHSLTQTEEYLRSLRNHGADAGPLHQAELNVTAARRKSKTATDEVLRSEEHLQEERLLKGKSAAAVYSNTSRLIEIEQKHLDHLNRLIQVEGETPALQEKKGAALKRLIGWEGDAARSIQLVEKRNTKLAQSLEAQVAIWNGTAKAPRKLENRLESLGLSVIGIERKIRKTKNSRLLPNLKGELSEKRAQMRATEQKLEKLAGTGGKSTEQLSGSFEYMSSNVGKALEAIITNTSGVMKALGGANIPKFSVKTFVSGHPGAAYGTKQSANEYGQGKQSGGFIVPGSGSGDSFHTAIPPGSFVLNREATRAFGFQGGGMAPVVLEPRERVFMPREVSQIGSHNLAAMNAAAPRFAKGGRLGPEPAIAGPSGALRSLGQSAIHDVYQGAQHYLAKHKPKFSSSAVGGGDMPLSQFLPLARRALKITGHGGIKGGAQTLAWLSTQESGRNPNSINTTDSNAAAGNPSQGLMEVTGSTFRQYHQPGTSRNIKDPLANLAASINYQFARYGHLVHFSPYAKGGAVGLHGPPLFHGEGPQFYSAAFKHNRPWATDQAPWATHLDAAQEKQFRAWVQRHHVPFNPNARRQDYDMRGFWRETGGAWSGGHFPDTFKTPFDTTFSNESRYAKKGTPFVWTPGWKWLYDRRTGQEIASGRFAKGGLVGGKSPKGRPKWAGWDPNGLYHGVSRLAKGGKPKKPTRGSASDAVAWAMHHIGSTDQWGYPGEWCGAFLAADMRAQHLPVPGGFASAANWASYGSNLGRNNVQAGAILDYGSAHVALAVDSSKQVQGNDMHGKVGTSGIGGIIGGSGLTAVRWPPYSDKPGAGSAVSEKIPAIFHGARTKGLHFPSVPKSLRGVERQISRWQRELHLYRHATKAADGAPAIQHALEANVKAIENQLRKLRAARKKLRREKARRKFTERMAKKLGRITGLEPQIEARERDYNIASQFAEQTVDLEPQEAILAATASEADRAAAEKAYVANYSAYIEGNERPAYQDVLAKAAAWRNEILHAEYKSTGIEQGWEGGIRKHRHKISRMEKFIQKAQDDLTAFRKDNPKGPLPDWIEAELAKMHRFQGRLPMLRFQKQELEKVLGEGRESFFGGAPFGIAKPVDLLSVPTPIPGSGTFEGDLESVQGVHWPGQHEYLGASALAPPRQPGSFGGAIWDVQTSIEELGLKIAQAGSNAGSGGGGETGGKSEREGLLEELLLQERQGKAVLTSQSGALAKFNATYPVGYPFMGAFAKGGVALVGERGPELATMPSGTRISSASETSQMMSPNVEVHINGAIVQEPGDTRDPYEVIVNDRRFPADVSKHARGGRGTGSVRTPGGAR